MQNEKPAERRTQEALGFPRPPTLKKANFREKLYAGRLPPRTSNVIRPVEAMPGTICSRSGGRLALPGGHLGALRVSQSHKEESPGTDDLRRARQLAPHAHIVWWPLGYSPAHFKSPLGCLGLPTSQVIRKRKGNDFPVRVSRASPVNTRLSEDPV